MPASTVAWLGAWVLIAGPAVAQPPEVSGGGRAAKPRAADGWRQRVRQDTPANPAAEPESDPAVAPGGPAASTPDPDTAEGTRSTPAMQQSEPATKPGDAAKGSSSVDRRTVTGGSGDRALAAEKAAIDAVSTKTSIDELLARALPRRSDRAGDWLAGAEPLHHCGEPRWIEPCIPLPPCHPSHPPHPHDLVGVAGDPTCGPIYRGPCCPRTGTRDDGPHPWLHRVEDRLFDAFYRTK